MTDASGQSWCGCTVAALPQARARRTPLTATTSGRLKTFRGIFLETMTDDALQRRRHIAVRLGEIRRLLFENGAHGFDGGLAVERALARDHLIEDRAERENI